jgi:hypothetical protein
MMMGIFTDYPPLVIFPLKKKASPPRRASRFDSIEGPGDGADMPAGLPPL